MITKKIVVGTPCVNDIPILSSACITKLCATYPQNILPYFVSGSLVYDARQDILNYALEENADYVMFIDSDIVFSIDAVEKLIEHDTDIVSGLYFGRRQFKNKPIAYDKITPMRFGKAAKCIHITDIDTPYRAVDACGLGFCLIKMQAIKHISKRYKLLFEPYRGLGEDFSFFYRAKKCGYKCYLDTTFELGHVGTYVFTKHDYLRGLQNEGERDKEAI